MKAICLIDTRNHAEYIDECIRSCLAQNVPAGWTYEVHVVDAASSDGTLEKLKAHAGRLTLHERANIGQSGAFELCRDLPCDVFLFCDGDDRISPNRLGRVLEVFDAHPGIVLVGNSITEIDQRGAPIRVVCVANDEYMDARTPGDAERVFAARCLLGTSRMAVRSAALARLLPFEKTVLFEADEYLFSLLPALGALCILSERLTDYRLHGRNNYQSRKFSAEKARPYRLVHEAVLACVQAACVRLALSGRYIELCVHSLQEMCLRMATYEQALQSRRKAVAIVLGEPQQLGLMRASRWKRLAFASLVWAIGLGPGLRVLDWLRVFRRSDEQRHSVCLL